MAKRNIIALKQDQISAADARQDQDLTTTNIKELEIICEILLKELIFNLTSKCGYSLSLLIHQVFNQSSRYILDDQQLRDLKQKTHDDY